MAILVIKSIAMHMPTLANWGINNCSSYMGIILTRVEATVMSTAEKHNRYKIGHNIGRGFFM